MRARIARDGLEHDPRRDILPEGRDPHEAAAVAAAAVLAATWGGVFAISYGNGLWSAERWDETGTLITALTPDDLTVRMRAAWDASPW